VLIFLKNQFIMTFPLLKNPESPMKIIKTHQHFLPQYWLIWLGIGILRLIVFLPIKWQWQIGGWLGKTIFHLHPKRRAYAKRNIERCLKNRSETEQKKILKESFEAMGEGLIESALAWWASNRKIHQHVRIDGLKLLDDALAKKKGVLILTPHITTLEVAGRIISHYAPTTLLQRHQNQPVINYICQKGRGRYSQIALQHQTRKLLHALKKGELICVLPDQDLGADRSIFVPFLNIEQTATITSTAKIARWNNCEALFAYCLRDKKRGHFKIVIKPLSKHLTSDDLTADTTKINEIFSNMILEHPSLYLWCHKRFKTRPIGEAPFYED
jgi:Kdo2-lipid IVA lauroyltransferase/acyltransferase